MIRFLRRKSAGGPAVETPAPRRRPLPAWRPTALAGLALAVLGLNGCASDPCGGCGGGHLTAIGNGIRSATASVQGAMARVFHCKRCNGYAPAGCDSCGGGAVVEGVPVEGGTVIPGPVVPGPSLAPPTKESNPTILDPVAPGPVGRPSSSNVGPASVRPAARALSSNDRPTSIESGVRGRANDLARAVDLSAPSRPGSANPLDDLPPVDLAGDVTRRGRSPVPAEADAIKPASVNAPAPAAPAAPNSSASASPREAEAPVLKASIDAPLAPGVRHFAAVRPGISGGSAPARDGLDWLKDKGIKSLVDLRAASEVEPGFADGVKARGFRYVALPIDVSKPDVAKLAAFRDEVTRAENQPVYFFDADGTRAGLIWYVHRLTFDKVDAQLASREAEELGLTEKADAIRLLDAAKSAAKPATSPSALIDSGSTTISTLLAPRLNADRPALSAANPSRAIPEASAQ